MIIQETKLPLETFGLDRAQSFKIKATGKAFKILSDGLYGNKPKAVIRELACNAYDSHVQAKVDRAFEVHLPISMEPWLAVKDWGVGLAEEEVLRLYVTYFESTKTNSNEFIGALGLGSKSPFCYSDGFMVISRFEGRVKTYNAFLDSQGTPCIAKVLDSPTRESNGLEVRVGIEPEDFDIFHSTRYRSSKYV